MRAINDPALMAPESDWSVGQHAAHTLQAQEMFAAVVGGASWTHPRNEVALANFGPWDRDVIAGGILSATERLLEAAAARGDSHPFHPGFGPMRVVAWSSYSVTHMLMHACPISQALGMPCPVQPED